MALANVACLLGRELADGQRVLAIDWDLEAPGLHYFFDSLNHSQCGAKPGVVELFTRLNSSLPDLDLDGQDDSAADKFVDSTTVTDFIYRSGVTNVDVMPVEFWTKVTNRVWRRSIGRVCMIDVLQFIVPLRDA
jgi:hypothetical protein